MGTAIPLTTTAVPFYYIVHVMRTWRRYLEGVSADMLVVTDHNPLVYLQTQIVLSSRQTRWSEKRKRNAKEESTPLGDHKGSL